MSHFPLNMKANNWSKDRNLNTTFAVWSNSNNIAAARGEVVHLNISCWHLLCVRARLRRQNSFKTHFGQDTLTRHGEATGFPSEVSAASMSVTSSSREPANKVNGGRDHIQPFPNVTAMISSSHWLLSANTSQSWLELMIGRSDFIVSLKGGPPEKSAEFETLVWFWRPKW